MGTITTRKRKDGTAAHTAQIRIRSGGVIIHSEAQTFDRLAAANLWLKKREAELAEPGALAKAKVQDPTLAAVIDQYTRESKRDLGKTKTQILGKEAVEFTLHAAPTKAAQRGHQCGKCNLRERVNAVRKSG